MSVRAVHGLQCLLLTQVVATHLPLPPCPATPQLWCHKHPNIGLAAAALVRATGGSQKGRLQGAWPCHAHGGVIYDHPPYTCITTQNLVLQTALRGTIRVDVDLSTPTACVLSLSTTDHCSSARRRASGAAGAAAWSRPWRARRIEAERPQDSAAQPPAGTRTGGASRVTHCHCMAAVVVTSCGSGRCTPSRPHRPLAPMHT